MAIIRKSPTSDKEFFENLSAALERARIEGGIIGMSVAIMFKGKLVFAQGFGKRNRVDPFTEKTVAHIASVTKAFTATAIGELVAEGKLDWDKTPVCEYLPEFQLKDPVLTSQLTFADMLAHRTPMPFLDVAWTRNATPPKVLINQLKHLDMTSKLSPTVNYSNIMYAVAGEAAANVAGMSYADLVSTKIFEPLGLKSAGLSLVEMAKQPNFAMPFTATSLEEAKKDNFEEGYIDEIPMCDAPAGDIYMDVVDLAKWGRVVLKQGELDDKQVLSKESIVETVTPHNIMSTPQSRPDFSPVQGYGYGWMLDSYKGQTIFHHSGSNPGYVSNLALFPDADLIIAHLGNINVAGLPLRSFYYIADELLRLPKTTDWFQESMEVSQRGYDYYTNLAKGNLPKRVDNQPPSHRLSEYTGEYTHPVYGKITIRLEEGNTLFMNMMVYNHKLEHYHYDSFTTSLQDFTTNIGLLFTFVTGGNGKVESIKTEMDSIALEFHKKVVSQTDSK